MQAESGATLLRMSSTGPTGLQFDQDYRLLHVEPEASTERVTGEEKGTMNLPLAG